MGLETFFVKKPSSMWTQYTLKLDLDCDTQIGQTWIFSVFYHMSSYLDLKYLGFPSISDIVYKKC